MSDSTPASSDSSTGNVAAASRFSSRSSSNTGTGTNTPASAGTSVAPNPAADTQAAQKVDSEIGRAVVDLGLISAAELRDLRTALKGNNQATDPSQRSLTDMLVHRQYITPTQAGRIRKHIESRRLAAIPGYELQGKLGKGAMATVYKARQVSLDRIVAIKVLPRKSSQDPEFVQRFYKEGQAAARLGHNNIVQAIDVGQTPDGHHYFVMEYLDGKTLYDIMQPPPVGEGRNFSEQEALDIGIEMADALAHAHGRGLIHRDVKPKNIILTPDGQAKLTDLGLARDAGDREAAETEAGKAYGTPYYISPEQIRGEVDIDHSADIYSLGATLYHMLTGRPPFEADTPAAVMHKHLKEDLVPPDHVNVALSAGISEVIEYAMGKDRRDRYATAQQMLDDLEKVRNGEAPGYARRQVDFESLAEMERVAEHQQTIDYQPTEPKIWESTAFIITTVVAAASLIVNAILAMVMLSS